MVYDAAADRTIVVEGLGPQLRTDTWSYDYTRNTWTNLTPSNPPSVRIGHAMTYEAFSGKVILFGGSMWGPDDSCFNDTWALSMPILLPASSNPSFPMR